MRGPGRVSRAALALVFLALPLGTAPLEIASGLALAAALLAGPRALAQGPLLAPILGVALSWALAALGRGSEQWVEALGRTWPLALGLAVPALARAAGPEAGARAGRLGLWAAAGVGLLAVGQAIAAGAQPWIRPATGFFSHHLTLGYALLPALAVALARRRWGLAAPILAGALCSGGSGPALSVVVLLAGVALGPGRALAGGLVGALALIAVLRGDSGLHEREVLWRTGATLAVEQPLGTGPAGFREPAAQVQEAIEPGFYFPLHAHDVALQLGALAGLGAWLAWAWLGWTVWRGSDRAGRAALAALLVGGLTQDTLGDLEVVRAWLAWAMLSWNPPAPLESHR